MSLIDIESIYDNILHTHMTLQLTELEISLCGNPNEKLLEDLSFSLEAGKVYGLIGPSGCGKTTLLKFLASILPTKTFAKSYEKFSFFSKDYAEFSNNEVIGYVSQKNIFFEWQNIENNLKKIILAAGQQYDPKRIEILLKLFGISEVLTLYPSELSGGMLSRVAIIRALALEPKLLLLDECLANIDDITKLPIIQQIREYTEQQKAITLFVTHNIFDATLLCDEIIVLGGNPAHIIYQTENKSIPKNGSSIINPDDYKDAFFKIVKEVKENW